MSDTRAGQPAEPADLVDVAHLVTAYFATVPDPSDPAQQVAFGTSGHRGSSLLGSFNEAHIVATTQAICEYRAAQGIDGPLFIGRDTHALSEPAWVSALEVLAANDVTVLVDAADRYTPTPAVSHAILRANGGRTTGAGLADGIVVTPSHNPPVGRRLQVQPAARRPGRHRRHGLDRRARQRAAGGRRRRRAAAPVRRRPGRRRARTTSSARTSTTCRTSSTSTPSAAAGVHIGADPLGGASVDYWGAIAERHRLDLTVVNPLVDPTWRFMTLDWDGKIRMDCSSPDAMASLIGKRASFDIATGNDADSDRHGIVTPDGLMNPNHFLAVAIAYLYGRAGRLARRRGDRQDARVLVDDRPRRGVARAAPVGGARRLQVVRAGPARRLGRASAARSRRARRSCAATAACGRPTRTASCSPCWRRRSRRSRAARRPSTTATLTERHGAPAYARVDAPATREEKARLGKLSPEAVTATELAGEPITARLTRAPGNDAAIGGLKVATASAWFAARPSGTEDVYKIYAESFRGPEHLAQVQAEARDVVAAALAS